MGRRMDDLHAPTVPSGPSSSYRSNGVGPKLSVQELALQKESLEAQLSALGAVLDSHGVTMHSSLTTFDGFPRSDIDVAQVRTTRAQIIRLRNDYKDVMAKLEVAVHEGFAAAASTMNGTSTNDNGTNGKSADVVNGQSAEEHVASEERRADVTIPVVVEPPFARVNSVTEGSPAASAGLRTGDKIVRFGYVDWTNHERLGKISQVVAQNENRSILVKVLREEATAAASQTLSLTLIPRRDWGGRGMLGCHVLPL